MFVVLEEKFLNLALMETQDLEEIAFAYVCLRNNVQFKVKATFP